MLFKPSRRLCTWTAAGLVAAALLLSMSRPLPEGLAYAGSIGTENVQLLVDETWVDETGERQVRQEIFEAVFEIIDEAERYVVLDFFLVNDFLYEPGPVMRPLSREIADRLIAKRRARPEIPVIFITDPINRMYGALESLLFREMEEAGVEVVWTDLDRLRDSNPVYSVPWRLLVRPWGVGPGGTLQNPLGDGRVSMRSMLKLMNFKANHRKLIITEKTVLVTSANPHSASSAHWNVALRIDGAGQQLALESERAVLRFSGAANLLRECQPEEAEELSAAGGHRLTLLTENRIEEKAVALLRGAVPEARIDLSMFYLSDRTLIAEILAARKRGCRIRVILDPNKDAFGRIKNGMPNRQTAAGLVRAGIPVRWADTHGEQFHVKMLYVENPDSTTAVMLGSCNFTRRNLDNFNAECNVVFEGPGDHEAMACAGATFDRWWSNPAGRTYTVDYEAYADPSLLRRFRAWMMEVTGLSSF